MNGKIEPALTPQEWRELARPAYAPGKDARIGFTGILYPKRPLAVIAALNDALPDNDPRKITREWVTRLRKWAADCEAQYGPWQLDPDEARAMADALESYLPPEPE